MEVEDDQENSEAQTLLNAQQRKLRYRSLLNKIDELNDTEELGMKTCQEIGAILKESNAVDAQCSLDDRVDQADETLLDAMVLSSASSLLVKSIEAVDVFTHTYEPSDFARRIMEHLANGDAEQFDPEQLMSLHEDVINIIPKVHPFHFVYGTYDLNKEPKPKEKKQRAKKEKEQAEKKKPEKVTKLEEEEQGIDTIVKELYEVLKIEYDKNDHEPIKYYDYVIDTDDFAQSVENIFYCAFLVRDGKAHMDTRNGTPYIKPMRKSKLKDFREQGGSNCQIISTVTYRDWEKFKRPGFLQQHKMRRQNAA